MSAMHPTDGGTMATRPMLPESLWDRLGAASGILFAILSIVSIFTAPQPPKAGDEIEVILPYYAHHRGGVLTTAYLTGLAVIFFLIFLANLYTLLRNAEGGAGRLSLAAAFGGLVVTAGIIGGTAFQTALAFRTERDMSDAAVVQSLFDMQNILFAITGFPGAVLFVSAALVILFTRILPVWLGWAGIVVAAVELLTTGGMLARVGPLASGGIIGLIGFVLVTLWILAASIIMLTRPRMVPEGGARMAHA